jgi:hypothetical protein
MSQKVDSNMENKQFYIDNISQIVTRMYEDLS